MLSSCALNTIPIHAITKLNHYSSVKTDRRTLQNKTKAQNKGVAHKSTHSTQRNSSPNQNGTSLFTTR